MQTLEVEESTVEHIPSKLGSIRREASNDAGIIITQNWVGKRHLSGGFSGADTHTA